MTGFKGFCHIPAPAPAQNLLLKHRSVVARTVVWYFTSSPHPPQLQRLWRSPAPRPPPGICRHPPARGSLGGKRLSGSAGGHQPTGSSTGAVGREAGALVQQGQATHAVLQISL